MSTVRLNHPRLPGRVLEVDERRIGARLAAGWVRAEQEQEAALSTAADTPPADDLPEPRRTPRSRRRTSEE